MRAKTFGLSGFPMRILSLFCLAFMLFFQEIESTIFFFFFPISLCLWIGLLRGPPSVWNVEMGQKAHTHKLLEMILVNPEKSGHWKRRQAQCPIITSLVDWAIGSHYWTTPAQISWIQIKPKIFFKLCKTKCNLQTKKVTGSYLSPFNKTRKKLKEKGERYPIRGTRKQEVGNERR